MRKIAILTLLMFFALAGCQATPKQSWANATQTYISVTQEMTFLAKAGKIDVVRAEAFESARAPASAALDVWYDCLLTGKPTGAAIGQFNLALQQMIISQQKARTK